MWLDGRAGGSSDPPALGLELAELVAMEPRHVRRPTAAGQRGPGGERLGRGWAQSTDFDGISPYHVGDDVRAIDWRASARSGKPQMRRFAAPSFRARMVVADLDPSLCFGTRDRLMAKTIALVAARLCWEALALQEPVGLALGSHANLQRPRRGKRHLLRLLELLQQGYDDARDGHPLGASPALLQEASARLQKADEICLVSDFGGLDADFLRTSSALAGRRSLRAFIVEDPVFHQAIPAGRYPLRREPTAQDAPARDAPARETTARDAAAREATAKADASRDSAVRIAGADTSGHPASINGLRRERNRTLLEAGWEVIEAADILPRSNPGQRDTSLANASRE